MEHAENQTCAWLLSALQGMCCVGRAVSAISGKPLFQSEHGNNCCCVK